jgi:hypothetical protein
MEKQYIDGDQVSIDTDNQEYGRVAGSGIVIDDEGIDNFVLIQADTIRACILVPREDITKV